MDRHGAIGMWVVINDDDYFLGMNLVDDLNRGEVPEKLHFLGQHLEKVDTGVFIIRDDAGRVIGRRELFREMHPEKVRVFSKQESKKEAPKEEPVEEGCRRATVDVVKGYEPLFGVLMDALKQASGGKGKERHANGLPFLDQPIMTIADGHGMGFLTGQATKKLQESHKLLELRGKDAAVAEMLGAIVYTAAAILHLQSQE